MFGTVGNSSQPTLHCYMDSPKQERIKNGQTNQLHTKGTLKREGLKSWGPKTARLKLINGVEYNYCSCSKQIIKMIRSLGALIWRVSIIHVFSASIFFFGRPIIGFAPTMIRYVKPCLMLRKGETFLSAQRPVFPKDGLIQVIWQHERYVKKSSIWCHLKI